MNSWRCRRAKPASRNRLAACSKSAQLAVLTTTSMSRVPRSPVDCVARIHGTVAPITTNAHPSPRRMLLRSSSARTSSGLRGIRQVSQILFVDQARRFPLALSALEEEFGIDQKRVGDQTVSLVDG